MKRKTKNAFDVVRDFEDAMAEYTGAVNAIAVDSGSMALFLCFARLKERRKLAPISREHHVNDTLAMPRKTFISVPTMAIHAGWKVAFEPYLDWPDKGYYTVVPRVEGTQHLPRVIDSALLPRVIDSALMLQRNHFRDLEKEQQGRGNESPFVCLSFQYRKHLPIGRGGMILCAKSLDATWLRRARFFGRQEVPAANDPGPEMLGWHGYMEPERAAKGLSLLMHMPDKNEPLKVDYPDLSQYPIFKDCRRTT